MWFWSGQFSEPSRFSRTMQMCSLTLLPWFFSLYEKRIQVAHASTGFNKPPPFRYPALYKSEFESTRTTDYLNPWLT